MKNDLTGLEPQQYEPLYDEDDVPLKDVRRSTLRRMVWIAAAMVAIVVTAGFSIRIPDEVSLPFVLRGESPEQVYRFPYPVYVEESFAAAGDRVAAGDPLVRISSPEIVALIGTERLAAAALENYRSTKRHALADSRAIIGLQAEQNAHSLKEIRQRQVALDRTWASNSERLRFEQQEAFRRLQQHRALFESKHISAQELNTFETEQLRTSDALTTATEAYRRDRAALLEEGTRYELRNRALRRESDRSGLEACSDSTGLANSLAAAQEAIRSSFGAYAIAAGSLLLRAPEAGMVSFAFDGERELPASAILLKLRPAESGVYAAAVSPGAVIGKLHRRQIAYLKVASFPAYEWGAAKGHIERLSLTPDEKGGFGVRVSIDDPRRLKDRLQPGMDGRMIIQLRERSFFGYFFRNLQHGAAWIRGED